MGTDQNAAYRIGGEVICHGGSILVFDKDRHVIFDRNVLGEDVHIPVIVVYPSALSPDILQEPANSPTCSAS